MKLFKILLSALLFTQPVYAGVGTNAKFTSVTGADYSTNLIKNPSAFDNALNVTTSNAIAARDTAVGKKLNNVASFGVTSLATSGFVDFLLNTASIEQEKGNCQFKGMYLRNTSGPGVFMEITDGSAVRLLAAELTIVSEWSEFSIIYPCGADGARKVRLFSSNGGTQSINLGNLYYGKATGIGLASANYGPISYTPTFTGFGTVTGVDCKEARDEAFLLLDCAFTTGTHTATQARVSLPAGLNVDAQAAAYISRGIFLNGSVVGAFSDYVITLAGVNYVLFGRQDAGSGGLNPRNGTDLGAGPQARSFSARIPIAGWVPSPITSVSSPSVPKIVKYTSGSGTYTPTAGTKYIKVRMVGAGGGGGGSGTGGSGVGGTGGATTLGTSFLTANGGVGGAAPGGGAGGTVSAVGITATLVDGGGGGAGTVRNTVDANGGMGAASPFGGAGGSLGDSSGRNAAANSGSGGGGAGVSTAGATAGGGGGAGGYIEALITNPSAMSYAVGALGSAGTAGTSGRAAGTGGSGYIEITEYFSTSDVIAISLANWQLDAYDTRAGFGSTNTNIPYFTNVTKNSVMIAGTTPCVTIANSSTNGFSITAIRPSDVTVTWQAKFTGTGEVFGISYNATPPITANITALAKSQVLAYEDDSGRGASVSGSIPLAAGEVLRPHSASGNLGTAADWLIRVDSRCQ